MKKFAVCVPGYKIMDAPAVESLVVMMSEIHERGDHYRTLFTHSIFIEAARSALFKAVTDHAMDVDFVLCIDTDHVYKAATLYGLAEAMDREGLDMLSAGYRARGMPSLWAHVRGGKKLPYEPDKGLVDCDVVGMGFLLLRPRFVKRMWDKHGHALFAGRYEGGVFHQGDDARFCELAKAEGARVAFHSGLRVGHISNIVL